MVGGVLCVRITSTLSRTNSSAISAKRSVRPSPQRYSIATLWPSVQPSARSRCTKAAVKWLISAAVPEAISPMVGTLLACCARRKRPSDRRAAEQRDEIATSHYSPKAQEHADMG